MTWCLPTVFRRTVDRRNFSFYFFSKTNFHFHLIQTFFSFRYQRLADAGPGQLCLLPTIPQSCGENPGGAVSLHPFSCDGSESPENLFIHPRSRSWVKVIATSFLQTCEPFFFSSKVSENAALKTYLYFNIIKPEKIWGEVSGCGWLCYASLRRVAMMRNLLAPYEQRPWAQTNWILVRLWRVSNEGHTDMINIILLLGKRCNISKQIYWAWCKAAFTPNAVHAPHLHSLLFFSNTYHICVHYPFWQIQCLSRNVFIN